MHRYFAVSHKLRPRSNLRCRYTFPFKFRSGWEVFFSLPGLAGLYLRPEQGGKVGRTRDQGAPWYFAWHFLPPLPLGCLDHLSGGLPAPVSSPDLIPGDGGGGRGTATPAGRSRQEQSGMGRNRQEKTKSPSSQILERVGTGRRRKERVRLVFP